MTLPLRIGVAGAGHLGKIHLNILQSLASWQCIGFYDPSDAVKREVTERFAIPSFDSLERLIDSCDVLDIVSPTHTHFEIAQKAIQAGKHVFIEKPICDLLEQANILKTLTLDYPVKVQVGHVERFNPAFQIMKDRGIQPLFVEAHRLATFQPRRTEVSVVMDLMIHDIDVLLSIIPSPITSVHASGVTVLSQHHDMANARLEFVNGWVANLTASRMSMKQMRKMRFFQPDRYVSIDFLEKEAECFTLLPPGDSSPDGFELQMGDPKNPRKIVYEKPEVPPGNAIADELRSFYEAIIQDRQTAVGLNDAIAALEVAIRIQEKIDQSNRQYEAFHHRF